MLKVGPISFDCPDRVGVTAFYQIQGGAPVKVALYHPEGESLDLSCPGCHALVWPGGEVPASRVFKLRVETVDPAAFILMSSLATLGILMALAFLAFNLTHRRLKKFVSLPLPPLFVLSALPFLSSYSSLPFIYLFSLSLFILSFPPSLLHLNISVNDSLFFSLPFIHFFLSPSPSLLFIYIVHRALLFPSHFIFSPSLPLPFPSLLSIFFPLSSVYRPIRFLHTSFLSLPFSIPSLPIPTLTPPPSSPSPSPFPFPFLPSNYHPSSLPFPSLSIPPISHPHLPSPSLIPNLISPSNSHPHLRPSYPPIPTLIFLPSPPITTLLSPIPSKFLTLHHPSPSLQFLTPSSPPFLSPPIPTSSPSPSLQFPPSSPPFYPSNSHPHLPPFPPIPTLIQFPPLPSNSHPHLPPLPPTFHPHLPPFYPPIPTLISPFPSNPRPNLSLPFSSNPTLISPSSPPHPHSLPSLHSTLISPFLPPIPTLISLLSLQFPPSSPPYPSNSHPHFPSNIPPSSPPLLPPIPTLISLPFSNPTLFSSPIPTLISSPSPPIPTLPLPPSPPIPPDLSPFSSLSLAQFPPSSPPFYPSNSHPHQFHPLPPSPSPSSPALRASPPPRPPPSPNSHPLPPSLLLQSPASTLIPPFSQFPPSPPSPSPPIPGLISPSFPQVHQALQSRLNNTTVVGTVLVYTAVILLGLDHATLPSPHYFPVVCTARAYLLSAGFSLAFGSMFTKTYRVHQIFTRSNSAGVVKNKLLKDKQLIGVIMVLLVVDIIIVSAWMGVDPMTRHLHNLTLEEHREVVFQPQGLLVSVGVYMAWETRHVKIPALNDSQYIGMSVYNVVITSIIVIVAANVLGERTTLAYVIITTLVFVSTTTTLCLLFIPKILTILRKVEEDPIVESMGLKIQSNTRRLLTEDKRERFYRVEIQNKVYRRELLKLEQELQKLGTTAGGSPTLPLAPGGKLLVGVLGSTAHPPSLRLLTPSFKSRLVKRSPLKSRIGRNEEEEGGEEGIVELRYTLNFSTPVLHEADLPFSMSSRGDLPLCVNSRDLPFSISTHIQHGPRVSFQEDLKSGKKSKKKKSKTSSRSAGNSRSSKDIRLKMEWSACLSDEKLSPPMVEYKVSDLGLLCPLRRMKMAKGEDEKLISEGSAAGEGMGNSYCSAAAASALNHRWRAQVNQPEASKIKKANTTSSTFSSMTTEPATVASGVARSNAHVFSTVIVHRVGGNVHM
ncbi:putative gamma-aminobutyric acid type B receptor subunit 2 [Penaeus vannamei]|uniref:Putative gamma-aminobutyric acid type B receptor subunit 2 n=1 Tax=Penaeus vannamei TaxID=6689 RepID=A0A3R7SX23_PENVA|nr:putative gamma-aminobutyric acid type B receptor subunit 2 [Penaeus vannamei]